MQDLTNKQFERLTVLRRGKLRNHHQYWLCVCACGRRKQVRSDSLLDGAIQSCGCLAKERRLRAHTTHGHGGRRTQSPEYRTYFFHRNLCRNPKARDARWFHDKGIQFLFDSFEDFLAVVGLRPGQDFVLTRYDRNQDFGPGNVYWRRRRRRKRH